ncbi:WXG100 family type VII secretion target [Nonomuraea sp. NPDC050451]|uniref:WXG100 family type VII secretion target n=1 Tax=Nonomuraea sp. NPDC050451 TaxID=3364364 RepID=UPI0037B21CF5
MGDEWKPIRLYDYLGDSKPGIFVTRAQVVSYLKATDPDRIESAGNSYIKAAELVHGKSGLEGTLMKAAEELAEVWRGDGATTALEALRLLHASAAALGDAMEKTGKPMVQYAQQLRTSKTTMPGPTALSITTNVDNEPSTNLNPQLGSAGYLVDVAARNHLEQLNNKINDLNAQMAEGLAFKLPEIQPMVVETQKQDHLDPGSGTNTPSGETRYWTGDGTGDGSKGSTGTDGTTGTGRDGSDGSNGSDGKGDQNPGKDQDPGRDDPGQDPGKGQDDPSTGDPSDPQQPGNGTGTGGSPQKPGDQDQSVPPVIGADPPKTQLADAGNPTFPTTTTPTTGYPQQSTPNLLTNPPTTQVPTSTPFSPVPGQGAGGPGTWYGMGGSGSGAAPAVLRGGAGASGPGIMAYPPGGMGAGGDQRSERDREIYDPEGDIWSSTHQTSPDRIG